MDVQNNDGQRWRHVRKILERSSPFCHPDFEPSTDLIEVIHNQVRVLVIGAGGLGCELLKNLALLGFRRLDVIDMDTIDISNLNRQFLFRMADVGKSKAEVAAAFINKRVQGMQVVPHFCKIQDKSEEFYREFHIVVCGLDSIVARRWLNGMIMSLVNYDDEGTICEDSVKFIVDGGTEGFKGNARIIIPGKTPCIECTLDLYPPQVNFPLCTIAHTPRLPEHCIEYVRILLWPKETPFDVPIDGDDPNHINWVHEKALERAAQYGITGVTYRLTQGVIKHIIPAVATTNAIIAAACSTEVFKIASGCCKTLDNYMVFSNTQGIYSYTYSGEKKEDCITCSQKVKTLEFKSGVTVQEVIDFLTEDQEYQMKGPGLTAMVGDKMKTLYMQGIGSTKDNLKKKLCDLGVVDGGEITIADVTTPNAISFKISFLEEI